MVPNLPTSRTPMAASGLPVSGGQAVAQDPVQAELIPVSLEYQYRVRPLASASTGPALVLIFISAAMPEEFIPEPPIELDALGMDPVDMDVAPPAVPGEVLLPHAASSRAGMARTAGA